MMDRMSVARCGCTVDCLISSDNFNRNPEDIDGFDSTGTLGFAPPSGFSSAGISTTPANVLYIFPGGSACNVVLQDFHIPVHFSFTADVWFEGGGRAGFVWQIVGAGGSGAGKRYMVQIEPSDQDQFLDSDHSHCGVIRLFDLSNLISPVQIGVVQDVPVPGLTVSNDTDKPAKHKLNFCYNPETKVLSCYVLTVDNQEDHKPPIAHHAKNVTIDIPPYGDSEIWFRAESDVVVVYFDNYELHETKDTFACPCRADELQFSEDFSGRETYPEVIDPNTSDLSFHWWNPVGSAGWFIADTITAASAYSLHGSVLSEGDLPAYITADKTDESGWALPPTASVRCYTASTAGEMQIRLPLSDRTICVSLQVGTDGLLAIREAPLDDSRGTVLISKLISNVPHGLDSDSKFSWNTLEICYDGWYVTARAMLYDGRSYSTRPFEIGSFTGTSVLQLYETALGFNDVRDLGIYAWTDFSVSSVEVNSGPSDYGYGYGYDSTGPCSNGCECCGPRDCQVISDYIHYVDEIQQIVLSGISGGTFEVYWSPDGGTTNYLTDIIAVGDDVADFQSKIRAAFPGWENATVEITGGTYPNYTYAITIVGYDDPPEATIINSTDGDVTVSTIQESSATLDCRLQMSAGTVTPSGNKLLMEEGAELSIRSSYSGIRSDCGVDNSSRLAVQFQSSDYSAQIKLGMDEDYFAVVTLQSAEDEDDGTLQVSGRDPIIVTGLTPSTLHNFCFMRLDQIIAAKINTIDDGNEMLSDPVTEIMYINDMSGGIDIRNIETSHNVNDPNCDSCLKDYVTIQEECPDPCSPCRDKQLSQRLLARIAGLLTASLCDPGCSAVLEGFILEWTGQGSGPSLEGLCTVEWLGVIDSTCEDVLLFQVSLTVVLYRTCVGDMAGNVMIYATLGFGAVTGGDPPSPGNGVTVVFGPVDLGPDFYNCRGVNLSLTETSRDEGINPICILSSPLTLNLQSI